MGAHLVEPRKKIGRNLLHVPRQGQAPQECNDETGLGFNGVIKEHDPTVGAGVGGAELSPNDNLGWGLSGINLWLKNVLARGWGTKLLRLDRLRSARWSRVV